MLIPLRDHSKMISLRVEVGACLKLLINRDNEVRGMSTKS